MEQAETTVLDQKPEDLQGGKKPLKTISRAEVEEKTERVRQARELPKIPGKRPTFDEAEGWLKLLTPDGFNHLAIYLYRVIPVIIRKLVDPDAFHYIDCITREHVEDGLRHYIVTRHGGGKYKFVVNDLEAPKSSQGMMEFLLTISLDEAMPKLDYREVDINAKENMGYLNLLRYNGVIDGKGNLVNPGSAGAVVQSPDPSNLAGTMGNMFKDFMTMYAQLSKDQQATLSKLLGEGSANKANNADSVTQLLLERLKQDDPNKQVTVMTTLLTTMQGMLKGDSSGSDKLIEMINQNHRFQTEMMGKMFETMKEISANASKKQEGDGFFDGLVKFASLKEKLPELFGGGHSEGKKHIGEIIIDGVKELGLPVVGLVSQIIQAKTGAKPIVPVNPQQAQEMVDNNRNLPPSPEEVRRFQGAGSQERVVEMPNQTQQPQMSPVVQLISSYGQLLVSSIRQGKKGAELAVQVVNLGEMVGTDFFAILEQQGKDGILQGMRSIPQFWQATAGIYGEAYMDTLVEEFLNYEEILEREESEGEGEKGGPA